MLIDKDMLKTIEISKLDNVFYYSYILKMPNDTLKSITKNISNYTNMENVEDDIEKIAAILMPLLNIDGLLVGHAGIENYEINSTTLYFSVL